jgi:hypothetical protein
LTRVIQRILLVLLLLCGRSYSVCYDAGGSSFICAPLISALTEDGGHDSCPCPCGEDDCEEHEVESEILPAHSVQVPEPTSLAISIDGMSWLNTGTDLSTIAHARAFPLARNGLDPAPGLRRAMLTGVVMLV